MKRYVIIIFLLIAAYLVLQKTGVYAAAVDRGTNFFRKAWLALTTGAAPAR